MLVTATNDMRQPSNGYKNAKPGLIFELSARMKLPFIATLCLLLSFISSLHSQTLKEHSPSHIDSITGLPVYRVVESMPEVAGGESALYKHLAENIKLGSQCQHSVIPRFVVAFVITESGEVTGFRTLRPIEDFEPIAVQVKEALTSINWTPGTQKGEAVNVLMLLPILIHLD